MLLHEDTTTEGTVGGGRVEAEVRERALGLLRRGRSELLAFDLDQDIDSDDGLICGGRMRVAVTPIVDVEAARPFADAAAALARCEPAFVSLQVEHQGSMEEYRLHIEAPAKLVIAGAGHVGAAVAKLAVGLDFEVVVIDDRREFAGDRLLSPPIKPVVGDIVTTLREQPIDANTFVVIVTRWHKCDEQALHAVIDSEARYIGMIGSRRKIKTIFDNLEALGVDRQKLSRVHSPIGLAIGAVTVPEIAVSIVGQLIEVRRSEKPTRVEGPFEVSVEGEAL